MMTDLDHYLTILRDVPADARLSALDAPVMAGVARRREQQVARRGLMLASLVAVAVGTSAALVPGGRAEAVPLLGVPQGAPSHLLVE